MSIDLSQFHQVFFEESLEGLDIMEKGLLGIDPQQPDAETINSIFRAAHSIKGGSGTFGFTAVTNFTHVLETLQDEIRANQRGMDQAIVDLFLQAVDCLRTMMQQLQAHEAVDTQQADALQRQFEAILAATPDQHSAHPQAISTEALSDASGQVYRIRFVPGLHVIATGNEPARIIRELKTLGQLSLTLHTDAVPDFYSLDPELCYLSWSLTLTLNEQATLAAIHEVFEWVVDESTVTIEPVTDRLAVKTTAALTAPTPGSPPADKAEPSPKRAAEAQSIRVAIDKIDSLINMVGELVITQSMLGQLGKDFDLSKLANLQEGLSQLEHNTRELQESVMRIRMLPISFTFSRFPRLIRDLSQKLDKQIKLTLLGEQTELDKTVMEKISDPLVHMVRNSLDHGIESAEERRAAGKPEEGNLVLNAYHQGGNIVIEISDDGLGLDPDKILRKARENGLIGAEDQLSREQLSDLIFQPGFSTAKSVSDVSGRGVGMDVVRRNITELNGSVEIDSVVGQGSTFRIRLPLTLAILDGQLVSVGNQTYIFPLVSIVESIQIDRKLVNSVAGGYDVLRLRDEYVPIMRLHQLFDVKPNSERLEDGLLVVVEGDNRKVGLVVDDLLEQQQVVIKSLDDNYYKIDGISGATILGDGTVALIIDIAGLVHMAAVKQCLSATANSSQAA